MEHIDVLVESLIYCLKTLDTNSPDAEKMIRIRVRQIQFYERQRVLAMRPETQTQCTSCEEWQRRIKSL
jgi:hypothetical protein